MNKHRSKNKNGLLPYSVIKAAASGDASAVETVVEHFGGYITVLSARTSVDEYGDVRISVDEKTRRRLETKLITKILTFKVA
jgi:hypothetical protein